MKSKIIFSIILSAMLLTACQAQKQLSETHTERTETASQSVTTASETETEAPETTTVTTSEAVSETTTTTSETLPPKIENISENVTLDIHKINIKGTLTDGEYSSAVTFFTNNIAAKGCFSDKGGAIRFFDMNDMTVKASVTAPDDWAFDRGYYPCIKGSGDVLCKIPLIRFNNDKLKSDYAVILVYNDFTTKFIEGEPREILSFPAGNHTVSDYFYDLFDIDSGEVIVEGFEDAETELGLASKWFDYKFQIDDDSFVYRTCGFEWMPGFGYYDFTNGKAADFPNSEDFMPIGYHDGKIYAELTAWDGMCQGEIRTFDTETLESKLFMPPNQTSGKFTEYTMSPDGNFIIANDFDGSGINILRIISPDSGENLVKCELNFGGNYGSRFTFIDNNRFAAEYGSELIIFDVKM